jgi:putative protein-disulfide isomerase
MQKTTLLYISDPMCSWCYGFNKTLVKVREAIADKMDFEYVLSGLAPDSDEAMTSDTKDYIQGQWKAVEKKTGVKFNWDFWDQCEPRRSTYPACRAVLATKVLDETKIDAMFAAIQDAYYQNTQNPSNLDVLTKVAESIGLKKDAFEKSIQSPEVEALLQEDLTLHAKLGKLPFPSLVIRQDKMLKVISEGFVRHKKIIAKLEAFL